MKVRHEPSQSLEFVNTQQQVQQKILVNQSVQADYSKIIKESEVNSQDSIEPAASQDRDANKPQPATRPKSKGIFPNKLPGGKVQQYFYCKQCRKIVPKDRHESHDIQEHQHLKKPPLRQ